MKLRAAALALAIACCPAAAHAFCGFYVAAGEQPLANNATLVVLMRDGTRTVLSMQNDYDGPPQDFAMVVPVPVVLQKANVKTLPRDVFDHVDQLTAPRLVEYWEQDPCPKPATHAPEPPAPTMQSVPGVAMREEAVSERSYGVKIEAKFAVGEYDILILGARDSAGLDAWLRDNHYKIPPAAEPLLRPYVQMGMKFFVAKVNLAKVDRSRGRPKLSPLRFHFDSESFFLPVRLGLINSRGTQDLVAILLGRGKRFEVANYANVAIPTNLEVSEKTKANFASVYASIFDRTVAERPRSVVTEYSWDAQSCDPCPGPVLSGEDLMTLGADALNASDDEDPQSVGGFTVTRLHMRYGKQALGDDLFFRAAQPIEGGREGDAHGAKPSSINNFQARYIIRHPWSGPIDCPNPRRGVWGGPPGSMASMPVATPALDLAFAVRAKDVDDLVKDDIPGGTPLSNAGATPRVRIPRSGGCAGCTLGNAEGAAASGAAIAMVIAAAIIRRRRG
jgi:hypothetical protein